MADKTKQVDYTAATCSECGSHWLHCKCEYPILIGEREIKDEEDMDAFLNEPVPVPPFEADDGTIYAGCRVVKVVQEKPRRRAMTRDEFLEYLGEKFGDRWGPMAPDAVLPITSNGLAELLEKVGVLTVKKVPPLPLTYDPICPVCDAQPRRACVGRAIGDPHPQRRELAWQLQFSDLEDRIELLERRAAEEDDD